jgi:hypothetical protein
MVEADCSKLSFDMTIRKYLSEFGLNMFGVMKSLPQQDGLELLGESGFGQEYPCHIYMVGRRPRVVLDPASIQITEQTIMCTFKIQRENAFEEHRFEASNIFGGTEIRVECPSPHTEFVFYDRNDEIIVNGKAAILMGMMSSKSWHLLNLEVLYIGQSYGVGGARTAPDRLRNHSTLQGIYSEVIRFSPDQEVWLVLWSIEPELIASFDGRSKTYGTSPEEDSRHRSHVLRAPITEQQINFTEAALIRYFEPEYNSIYKNSFPNPAHKTYSDCYDIDLNMISVTIQTNDIGCQLYTNKVAPKWTHIAAFPLHSAEERKAMFDPLLMVSRF